ncbi:MAG: hypothetical protein AAB365_02905 [Patescibacteria group bacterium]
MDISQASEKLIRDLWDARVPDRNKGKIGSEIMKQENLGAASFMCGMSMGIALGEAKTPEEAIERIKASNL